MRNQPPWRTKGAPAPGVRDRAHQHDSDTGTRGGGGRHHQERRPEKRQPQTDQGEAGNAFQGAFSSGRHRADDGADYGIRSRDRMAALRNGVRLP